MTFTTKWAKMLYTLYLAGRTDGLEDRIDTLYTWGKITSEEYNYLTNLFKTEGTSET